MSDFFSGSWSLYIALVSLGGIVFCIWLLFSQRAWLKRQPAQVEDTGHVWDGTLRELNNPVPRWWTIMYLALCVFALAYLLLYPGLGAFRGLLSYSSADEVSRARVALDERIRPVYERYGAMPFEEIAADPEAREIGQRLFLNQCAQCHGSDARGGPGFPNLTDRDWLYGGEPDDILHSITKGRHGQMPAWKAAISARDASNIAQYVRSLSGLANDPVRAVQGKAGFQNFCAACHGAEGKGNTLIGAPNLTNNIWLYGSSEKSIVSTILNGREGRMPAQERDLTPEQIRLLGAWVWGLSQPAGTTGATR